MKRYRLRNASIVGIVPAILEAILIYAVDPVVNPWIVIQACLFWFSCGFIISLLNMEIPFILKGIVFSVFMCLPWYIAESVISKKPEHFAPLIIASIIQGVIIGYLDKRLKMRTSLKPTHNELSL